MVSHYAVYVPFSNRVRGPSCCPSRKLQNDFFRLGFKAQGRGARARNPSREKLSFVNFSTDQENEIIHTFFISLGSNRGGRFQIKQTLN